MPANVPLALTAKPRRIAPPAFAVGHHCCAVCAQRPRRDGPHHAPTRPRRRRADQRRLARHAMRVVSHAMRVASATPPRRVTGLHRRRCLTDHHPRVFARMAPRHGAMARTIARRRSVDPGPDACRPGRPRHALHCAASRPIAIPPQPPVDAHAPGPPHPRAMVPALRVGDTPLRRQDDRPPTGQQRSHPVQPRLGTVRGHTAAGRCKDCPHQRPGAATGDARPAHHPVGMPPAGGLEGQRPARASPYGEGWLPQGALERVHVDPVLLEPARKPTHEALRLHGSAVHRGWPSRAPDGSRRYEADDPPGQGLAMPPLPPAVMWAEDLHPRMRETRRALPVDPPWTTVVPKSGSTDLRRMAGHALLLSANQAPGVWDGLLRTTGQAYTRSAAVSVVCMSSIGFSPAHVIPPIRHNQ